MFLNSIVNGHLALVVFVMSRGRFGVGAYCLKGVWSRGLFGLTTRDLGHFALRHYGSEKL